MRSQGSKQREARLQSEKCGSQRKLTVFESIMLFTACYITAALCNHFWFWDFVKPSLKKAIFPINSVILLTKHRSDASGLSWGRIPLNKCQFQEGERKRRKHFLSWYVGYWKWLTKFCKWYRNSVPLIKYLCQVLLFHMLLFVYLTCRRSALVLCYRLTHLYMWITSVN